MRKKTWWVVLGIMLVWMVGVYTISEVVNSYSQVPLDGAQKSVSSTPVSQVPTSIASISLLNMLSDYEKKEIENGSGANLEETFGPELFTIVFGEKATNRRFYSLVFYAERDAQGKVDFNQVYIQVAEEGLQKYFGPFSASTESLKKEAGQLQSGQQILNFSDIIEVQMN